VRLIVIDSSVLVDHLRGDAAAQEALRSARGVGDRLVASVVTRTELLVGMRAPEKRPTIRLLDALDWIPVDREIADRAGEDGRRLRRSHPGIGYLDLLIGSTAKVLDAELWTRNVRHFPMFPELQPPY
jgi:predicted nucleic acid-binding protein